MNTLNNYILEKLHINRNIKLSRDIYSQNIYDVEKIVQKFDGRGKKYKKYFITEVNRQDEVTLIVKLLNQPMTTPEYDKFERFGIELVWYLSKQFDIAVGKLGPGKSFSVWNPTKGWDNQAEGPEPLIVEISLKDFTITVTLNNK